MSVWSAGASQLSKCICRYPFSGGNLLGVSSYKGSIKHALYTGYIVWVFSLRRLPSTLFRSGLLSIVASMVLSTETVVGDLRNRSIECLDVRSCKCR